MDNSEKNADGSVTLAKAFHARLKSRLSTLKSRQRYKATEAVLSAGTEAYAEVNRGRNDIKVSAHGKTDHLRENHPNVAIGSAPTPALDLHASGGARDMALESELGTPKEVKPDYRKVIAVPGDADRYLVTRAKSFKDLGRRREEISRDSASVEGTITHTEVHWRHGHYLDTAEVHTWTVRNGKVIYNSDLEGA